MSTRRYLANSAVIPHGGDGTYTYRRVTLKELCAFVQEPFESRIGYPETAEFIQQQTGVLPAPSREPMTLEPGDCAFVVRLPYRMPDPWQKGRRLHPQPDEWELGILTRLT